MRIMITNKGIVKTNLRCPTSKDIDTIIRNVIAQWSPIELQDLDFYICDDEVSEDRVNHYHWLRVDDLNDGTGGTIKQIDKWEIAEEFNEEVKAKLRRQRNTILLNDALMNNPTDEMKQLVAQIKATNQPH